MKGRHRHKYTGSFTKMSTGDSPPSNMLAELQAMLDHKTFCDVAFVVGDVTIRAHKVVLASRSKVFKTMFLSGMKEQKDDIIEISNTTAEVFQQLLNYIYSREVVELEKIVEEMIVIADFYDVSDLKKKCEDFMVATLTEKTVARYVILADKLHCCTLKSRALNFIRSSVYAFEKAILGEDVTTMICLKEILSKNSSPKPHPFGGFGI